MAHVFSPEAEEVLDKKFNVLNKGFVRLVDYFGSDSSIVRAARVSYGDGTKSSRKDAGLIDYLIRHGHTSPLEMVELLFHIKLPIFVMRQWVRHRTANLNEQSLRYSTLPEGEFFVPYELRHQDTVNKQGSTGDVPPELTEDVVNRVIRANDYLFTEYTDFIESGVCREQARTILPVGAYTEVYWKIDLHNLFHFLRLRTDSHSQKEIRDYADIVEMLTEKVAPAATKAWRNHHKNAIKFSEDEYAILTRCIATPALEDAISGSKMRDTRKDELRKKVGV